PRVPRRAGGRSPEGDLASLSRLQPAPQPRAADWSGAELAVPRGGRGPREDPHDRSAVDEGGGRHDRGAVPRDSMTTLSANEYLFTSESVTEGHPDKIADQISDGVLDVVMRDDPAGRV